MYHAIANETCSNQVIKSVKDICDDPENKITYNISTIHDCYITDCNEYFTFYPHEEKENITQGEEQIYFGILMLCLAGFCCLICVCGLFCCGGDLFSSW